MKATVAFYKGKGDFTDKLIRWYTSSKYSHVELIVDDIWYSTSPRTLEIAGRYVTPKEENWEYIEVDIDYAEFIALYTRAKGSKYDWLGIFLSQFLPLGIHSRKRWFCSEFVMEALGVEGSNIYSPQDCYNYVKGLL